MGKAKNKTDNETTKPKEDGLTTDEMFNVLTEDILKLQRRLDQVQGQPSVTPTLIKAMEVIRETGIYPQVELDWKATIIKQFSNVFDITEERTGMVIRLEARCKRIEEFIKGGRLPEKIEQAITKVQREIDRSKQEMKNLRIGMERMVEMNKALDERVTALLEDKTVNIQSSIAGRQ